MRVLKIKALAHQPFKAAVSIPVPIAVNEIVSHLVNHDPNTAGKLIYREACRGTTTKVERHKVDPAMVPAREAANLRGGDEIVGFARGSGEQRLGTIWLVKRGQKVTRLREIPM